MRVIRQERRAMADLDDGRVLFAPLDEFAECKFRVFILVHIFEDFVYPLEEHDQWNEL
jgi:hypothetical protein